MEYLYPILAVLAVLLLIAARLIRDALYNAKLGRLSGTEWEVRRNSYFWEKRARR